MPMSPREGLYCQGLNEIDFQTAEICLQCHLFFGVPSTIREVLEIGSTYPGGAEWRVWESAWFMRPQLALMEPLLRAWGLPAFLSREVHRPARRTSELLRSESRKSSPGNAVRRSRWKDAII